MKDSMRHVYIIGSKGIPAKYGGFETFVEKLTKHQVDKNIYYHVACTTENSAKSGITDKHFEHNGAKCFNIDVPNIGPAKAIYYDIVALKHAIKIATENRDHSPIFYVLACRIGPFIGTFKKRIDALNGSLFVNPDGHEWMRTKWSYPVRRYWKYSEQLMVKYADMLICDSKNIEKYILNRYKNYKPRTNYISYGTDNVENDCTLGNSNLKKWYMENGLIQYGYYLIVGRFVPENNFEIMIHEFMKSNSKRSLVIVTTSNKKFLNKLENRLNFKKDKRIKFVGTVYNQNLLKDIRKNAYGYLHGHMVGGTNPSLLEALESTQLNLLLDVGFNKEVAEDSALYWSREEGNLSQLIEKTDAIETNEIYKLRNKAKKRIETAYTWAKVCREYEKQFLSR